jgi:hypothetical protein
MWELLRSLFSGINWASLPYTSLLALRLFALGTILWLVAMLTLDAVERLSWRYGAKNSLETLQDWNIRSTRAKRRVSSWSRGLALMIVGYVLGQAQIFSPVREMHNVVVLGKEADRVYTVQFQGFAKPMTIRLCADGDDLPLEVGMVVEPFQYIQRKSCMLINSSTYVDWTRDPRKNVVDRDGKFVVAKEE